MSSLAQDTQLEQDLDRLRYAAMDLITRLARQFRHKRNGIIFLINNYTYLVEVDYHMNRIDTIRLVVRGRCSRGLLHTRI